MGRDVVTALPITLKHTLIAAAEEGVKNNRGGWQAADVPVHSLPRGHFRLPVQQHRAASRMAPSSPDDHRVGTRHAKELLCVYWKHLRTRQPSDAWVSSAYSQSRWWVGCFSQLLAALYLRMCVSSAYARVSTTLFNACFLVLLAVPEKNTTPRAPSPGPPLSVSFSCSLSLYLFLYFPPSSLLVRTTLVIGYWYKHIHVAHPQPSSTSVSSQIFFCLEASERGF